jgi:hypothetical protein
MYEYRYGSDKMDSTQIEGQRGTEEMNTRLQHESPATNDVDRVMNRLVGALLAVTAGALIVFQVYPPR